MEQKPAAPAAPPTGSALATYRQVLTLKAIDEGNAGTLAAFIHDVETRIATIEAWFKPLTDTALEKYREIILMKVTDQATAGTMGDLVKDLRTGIKQVEAGFKPIKEAFHAAHKAVCSCETNVLAPFRTCAGEGQDQIDVFLRAEHKRQEAERLRLQQEAATKAAEERKQLQESAAAMEELGQGTAAAELREEAERVVAAPSFVPTVSHTVRTDSATVSAGKKLVVEVTDKKKFLKYLVEKESEAVFVEFKKSMLDGWVKTQGLKPGEVPGLHIEYTVKSSIR